MAVQRKRHFPAESKLVFEWTTKIHPYALQWRRVRVGPIPGDGDAKYYSPLRRYADLIFYEGGIVHLVEAKVRPDPGGISQLELYKQLFPKTPEYVQFKDQPIKLIYLTTFHDPEVKQMCEDREIEYVVYCPDWMKKYQEERLFRINQNKN